MISPARTFFLMSVLLAVSVKPSFAAEPPGATTSPAARPAAAVTQHEIYRQLLAFHRETRIGAYKELGRRNPKWDADVLEYLELIARQATDSDVPDFYRPAEPASEQRIQELGEKLMQAGCNDPQVLFAYAAHLPTKDAATRTKSTDLLRTALAEMNARKYPRSRSLAATIYLARLTTDRNEAAELAGNVYERLPLLCSGPMSGIERRTYLANAWSLLKNRNQQRSLVDAINKLPDADPWIKDVATGRLHIALAWDSRGNGPANTVTEEGWKAFHFNLQEARDALTRAWKLHPELPEAPQEMIAVAMGDGKKLNEDKLDWFDHALKAQVDYLPAYNAMVQASLPRWGGSYDEIMKLADACVAKPRYDTLVPWQYAYAVRIIGEDMGKPWAPLAKKEIYEKCVEVADQYATRLGSPRGDSFRSFHAAAAMATQRFAEGRKVLEELRASGGKPAHDIFASFGSDDPAWSIGSIYALSGPDAASVREAFEMSKKPEGRKEALAKLRAAQAKAPKDDLSQPFYTATIATLDADLKLAAGEWSPLVRGATLKDWLSAEGEWVTDGHGAILGSNLSGEPKSLIWRGRAIGSDPGRSFELAGTVEFTPPEWDAAPATQPTTAPATRPGEATTQPVTEAATQPTTAPATSPSTRPADPPGLQRTAGVVVAQLAGRRRGFAYLNFTKQTAGFVFGRDQTTHSVAVRNGVEFLLRVEDHTLTLFVDGKRVGEPYALGELFAGEIAVGVGGVEGSAVRFTNLRVRKIGAKPTPEGPGK